MVRAALRSVLVPDVVDEEVRPETHGERVEEYELPEDERHHETGRTVNGRPERIDDAADGGEFRRDDDEREVDGDEHRGYDGDGTDE